MTDTCKTIIWIIFSLAAVSAARSQSNGSLVSQLERFQQYPALFEPAAGKPVPQAPGPGLPGIAGKERSGVALTDHLAFFCRLEVLSERKTRFPFKVRLGTVDYVNRLERKTPGSDYFRSDRTGDPPRQYAPH